MFRTPWASLPPPSPTGLSSPCWQIEEQPASTLPPTQHPITAAFEWGAGGQPAALAVPRGPGSIQQRVVVCRVGLPACNARFCISDAKNHPRLFWRPLSGSMRLRDVHPGVQPQVRRERLQGSPASSLSSLRRSLSLRFKSLNPRVQC